MAGNQPYVKVVAANAFGSLGEVRTFRGQKRTGLIHRDGSQRNHTGDTTQTAVETVEVPALYQGGKLYAVRARAVFACTGAGGTKDLYINYGGSGFQLAGVAAGDQSRTIEVVIQATASNALKVTFVQPVQSWPTTLLSSPFTVNAAEDVTFEVDLANAGDSAGVQLTEVEWLGEVAA